MDKKKVDTELSFAEHMEGMLNSVLSKNKKVLVIVLIVIVVALIGLGIGSSVSKSTLNKQFNLIDELESTYSEIQAMDSEAAEV